MKTIQEAHNERVEVLADEWSRKASDAALGAANNILADLFGGSRSNYDVIIILLDRWSITRTGNCSNSGRDLLKEQINKKLLEKYQ